MRATASIAVLTAGLASLAASQSFDNYDRCAVSGLHLPFPCTINKEKKR